MTERTHDDGMGAAFGMFVVLPSVCSIGFGVFIIALQCLKWLQTAVWEGMTLRDGLVLLTGPAMRHYFPDTGALGLDKILTWALDSSPFALWSIVIFPLIWFSLGLLLFTYLMSDRPSK